MHTKDEYQEPGQSLDGTWTAKNLFIVALVLFGVPGLMVLASSIGWPGPPEIGYAAESQPSVANDHAISEIESGVASATSASSRVEVNPNHDSCPHATNGSTGSCCPKANLETPHSNTVK